MTYQLHDFKSMILNVEEIFDIKEGNHLEKLKNVGTFYVLELVLLF